MSNVPAYLAPTPGNLFFPPPKGQYQYFQAPPPTPQSSVELQASWAADAAMFAYARYGSTRMQEDEFRAILTDAGFTGVELFGDCFADNATTARGFFATCDSFAILAFRGTEKDNAADIAADADSVMVNDGARRIHRGFLHYFRTVRDRAQQLVVQYRKDHPTQMLYLTGHSLGAALATLMLDALADPASSLYTIGCPRVGDRAFCRNIEKLATTRACYRGIDNLDLVTHVPPVTEVFEYAHPNIAVLWLNPEGTVVQNPAGLPADAADLADLAIGFVNGSLIGLLPPVLPRPLADHSPARYCHWLRHAGEPQGQAATAL